MSDSPDNQLIIKLLQSKHKRECDKLIITHVKPDGYSKEVLRVGITYDDTVILHFPKEVDITYSPKT